MNGPSSDQLLSYLSPESRKMISAVQQQRQQEAAQFGAQLEQQKAALVKQKAIDDEKYNQYIANAPAYNDLRHDAAREKALRDINLGKQMLLLDLQGQPKDIANAQLQSYDDEVKMRYSNALKPFGEIEEGKAVVSNWKALQPNAEKIISVKQDLLKGAELLQQGDKTGALGLFKKTTAKGINSIVSSDALGTAEMIIKNPELLGPDEINILRNNPIWKSASPYIEKALQKDISLDQKKAAFEAVMGTVAAKDRKNFLDKMFGNLTDKMAANPYKFYESAVSAINSQADSYNSLIDAQVVAPSSPGYAKKIGAHYIGPVKSLAELTQERQKQQAQDNSFATGAAPGGSIQYQSQPVQAGSAQMAAPQAAPAPMQRPTDINEMLKQFGVIK